MLGWVQFLCWIEKGIVKTSVELFLLSCQWNLGGISLHIPSWTRTPTMCMWTQNTHWLEIFSKSQRKSLFSLHQNILYVPIGRVNHYFCSSDSPNILEFPLFFVLVTNGSPQLHCVANFHCIRDANSFIHQNASKICKQKKFNCKQCMVVCYCALWCAAMQVHH